MGSKKEKEFIYSSNEDEIDAAAVPQGVIDMYAKWIFDIMCRMEECK